MIQVSDFMKYFLKIMKITQSALHEPCYVWIIMKITSLWCCNSLHIDPTVMTNYSYDIILITDTLNEYYGLYIEDVHIGGQIFSVGSTIYLVLSNSKNTIVYTTFFWNVAGESPWIAETLPTAGLQERSSEFI